MYNLQGGTVMSNLTLCILTLWECIWAPLEWPKSVKRGSKYLYLVKNALGEFLGYFLKKLGYFLTKLSGHTELEPGI